MKRVLDLAVAMLGLTALAPLLAILAVAVKLESPGPVFYRGRRVGRHGKPFRMFKFRSMVVNADRIGGSSTADSDPLITRVGRFLRKYKLDELPQLINVLKGEMSFVGPRPEVQQYVDLYTPEEQLILTVRPGITDWATLSNADEGAVLAGSPDPDKTYLEEIRPEKVRLQLEYVKHQSMSTDMVIVGRTIATICSRILHI